MSSGSDIQRLGKHHMEMLAGMQNTVASSGTSAYGKKLMEKMGWSDGAGLGKDGTGIKKSIVVKKKDDDQGIGFKEAQANRWNQCWWFDAYDSAAKKIGKDSSSDSDSDSDEEEKGPKVYTDAELFAACKGRRLGMRARASQKGKWERSEDPDTLPSIPVSVYDEEKKKKKDKKSKKDKKDKKEKKDKKKEKKDKKDKHKKEHKHKKHSKE
ncbi:hypothetical protein WA588_006052 [Blastocystis sp. NMH]